MENFTPLTTAKKKKSNKFLIFGNIFLLLVMVLIGTYFFRDKLFPTKQKAVTPGEPCNFQEKGDPPGVCSHPTTCPDNWTCKIRRNGCGDCVPPTGGGGGGEDTPIPTRTPTPPPTATPTPPGRPALCQSASITTHSLSQSEGLTITSTSNNSDIKTFSYAFYNLDNLYGPSNPKPIFFVADTHYVRADNTTPPVTTHSINVTYDEINKPDLNWGSQKPTKIQVNAYFTNSAGGFSSPDPNCVVQFNLVSASPTPTPTNTPTSTPTNTPTPTRTPTPTVTPIISNTPTATPIISNTPTATPIVSNTPGPSATPIPVLCGTKGCDNATNPCRSGYNCVQANDGSNYCTSPDFTDACKANPSYNACCIAPGQPTATPTEIILAKVSTSPTTVVKLLQTGVVQSFMYFIPAIIMLIGLIL